MLRQAPAFSALLAVCALGCVRGPSYANPAFAKIPGGVLLDGRGQQHHIDDMAFQVTEVSVAMYRKCVRAGICSREIESSVTRACDDEKCRRAERVLCNYYTISRYRHPVDCVSVAQASEYCAWIGGRLPTEWEWEWAARGGERNLVYPWGDEAPDCTRAVMHTLDSGPGCGRGSTMPVTAAVAGQSVDGILNLIGNVEEWVSAREGTKFTSVGGSWLEGERAQFRYPSEGDSGAGVAGEEIKTKKVRTLGFRCVIPNSVPAAPDRGP